MIRFFISKLSNITGDEESEFYSYQDGKLKLYTSMSELYEGKPRLVSFDWDSIISWLRVREEAMPLKIVDIEQIGKQLYGRKISKDDQAPWSIWQLVKPFYNEDENDDFIKVQNIYYGLEEADPEDLKKLYKKLLTAIALCYNELLVQLEEKAELNRYENVERIIRVINLERTYKGISINTENVADWISKITRSVYKLRNQLQLEYGIISPVDKQTVLKKIEDKALIKDAITMIEEKGYYFFLKDAKNRHPLIKLLYLEKKTTTDLNSLLSIGALKPLNKKIYPIYDSFGTITARTKMVSPNFQNLSRDYRSIVQAEKNKVLVYIDYAQFEAGILANDSKDEELIEEYNSFDIYDAIGVKINISQYIIDYEDQRKFCKSLFYKYSYGMDIKNHTSVLKDYQLIDKKAVLSPLIIQAFGSYKALDKYREKIKNELKTTGMIGTHNGNFRYKLENEQNLSWALSQRIQGTASLILKKAIISLRREDKTIEFLIPMHDAALFQVPKKLLEEKQEIIQKVFEEEFSIECPLITASAKFKDF